MHYVMSDIHGEINKYRAMLQLIGLSPADTLYILGDVIDRKPSGVDILLDIMNRDNAVMLLGNHEQMCLDTLGPRSVYGSRQLWQSNGGSPTRRELLYMRTPEELADIIRFLLGLPEHLEVMVNGQAFYLVHGYPTEAGYGPLWERPDPDGPRPFPDKTVIVGHTPTVFLTEQTDHFHIWHGDGIIDIDCGCGNQTEMRRLACLRLEDFAEFYV